MGYATILGLDLGKFQERLLRDGRRDQDARVRDDPDHATSAARVPLEVLRRRPVPRPAGDRDVRHGRLGPRPGGVAGRELHRRAHDWRRAVAVAQGQAQDGSRRRPQARPPGVAGRAPAGGAYALAAAAAEAAADRAPPQRRGATDEEPQRDPLDLQPAGAVTGQGEQAVDTGGLDAVEGGRPRHRRV